MINKGAMVLTNNVDYLNNTVIGKSIRDLLSNLLNCSNITEVRFIYTDTEAIY